MGGQSTPHRTEPGEERNCINHETISNGDAFLPQLHHMHRWPRQVHHTSGQLCPPMKQAMNVEFQVKRKQNDKQY